MCLLTAIAPVLEVEKIFELVAGAFFEVAISEQRERRQRAPAAEETRAGSVLSPVRFRWACLLLGNLGEKLLEINCS
jgi:hypothetical protein